MTDTYSSTPQTRPSRAPQRVSYDRAAVHAALDAGFVCHVGFVVDGRPVVLPHLYARAGEVLYLHGSTGARAMLAAGPAGLPVCVAVTHVDALVLARSAFHHSINYRSVVVHGSAVPVTDPQEKARALDALVDSAVPGRSAGCRPPSPKESAATTVLRVPLLEVSLKARTGPPVDDDEDLLLDHWAGLVPVQTVYGEPVAAQGVAGPFPG